MRTEKLSANALATLLKEADEGVPVVELLRRYGLSRATFFRLRAKHRTTEQPAKPDAKRVRQLETENAELKRVCAELRQENIRLRGALMRTR